MYGEELPKEVDPLPTLLTAYPMRGSRLISIAQDEGIEGCVAEGWGLTLADTIAPHWFIPPEGTVKINNTMHIQEYLHQLTR